MAKLSVLALPILALVAACAPSTGADDDDQTTESSVTVTSGEGAATVTLHMPAGYDPNVAEFGAQFELSVNGTVVTPEKPTKVSWNLGGSNPITCITGALKSTQATHAVMTDCSIQPLQKNETRTITMSLLKLWWSNYPQVWANYVSHYATEKVTLEHERKGQSWHVESDGSYAFLGRNGIAMPVVAGTYRYMIGEGVFEPIRFAVAEGTVADVNVGYDAYNAVVELSFEDRGGFPNAPTPSLWLNCLSDARTIVRPDGAAKQTVTILDHIADSCTVTAGLFEQTVRYSRSATTKVQFRRLNVDDVELFDGTKSRGRYQVKRKDSGKLSPWNPTGTGLDLLPGEYQLEIFYQNGARQQITDVDLR